MRRDCFSRQKGERSFYQRNMRVFDEKAETSFMFIRPPSTFFCFSLRSRSCESVSHIRVNVQHFEPNGPLPLPLPFSFGAGFFVIMVSPFR
jgi:hypothetical protein